ncbi:unnamed protein product [Trichogramma brassicae]|uniref:Uncharacterized protein n=1 Tax=Trichogramma brassicae TaxID=86971 RepID=A0A6H5IFW6_9HYME|nr:unnamed protein product [Trichogramma brassicae]
MAGLLIGLTAYSNISESDSEGESEARAISTSKNIDDNNEQKDDSSNTNFIELPQQRRPRRSRKDASDSGIQEDVGNGNDEASHSSDSDFIHCTPIKHKRSSSANPFQKNNRGIASWGADPSALAKFESRLFSAEIRPSISGHETEPCTTASYPTCPEDDLYCLLDTHLYVYSFK